MRRSAVGVLLGGAALCTATPSYAHLVNSGLGPFYDGALHLVLTPMDIVGLATLGLFAGSQGVEAGRLLVVATPIAWFLAGLAALISVAAASLAAVNAGSLVLLGGVVALGLRSPPLIAVAAAVIFGGLLGFQGGIELRIANADWVALLGAAAVVLAIVLSVTALVVSAATAFPFRVACRVLGSWVAATGLLSIGWILAANR